MVPVWAIPIIVQIGSKLIDLAFKEIGCITCPEKQAKVMDKIEKNDKKAQLKKEEADHDGY